MPFAEIEKIWLDGVELSNIDSWRIDWKMDNIPTSNYGQVWSGEQYTTPLVSWSGEIRY